MRYYDKAKSKKNDSLSHHGILGQKWGIRRFQNKDGSLKPAGKNRNKESDSNAKKSSNSTESTSTKESKKGLSDKQKKALKIGAAAVGTALAAYGGYKLYQAVGEKSKTLSTEQLKSIGIKTVEPGRIKVDTTKVEKTPVSTFKPTLEFNTSGPAVSTSSRPTQTASTRTTSSNIKGSQTFNKAAQANDDLINELLNKNSKMLANF